MLHQAATGLGHRPIANGSMQRMGQKQHLKISRHRRESDKSDSHKATFGLHSKLINILCFLIGVGKQTMPHGRPKPYMKRRQYHGQLWAKSMPLLNPLFGIAGGSASLKSDCQEIEKARTGR